MDQNILALLILQVVLSTYHVCSWGKKGDWVWTSPISFVASSNCALHCGANIDFVDIDLESYNISPIKLEEKLRQAEKIEITKSINTCSPFRSKF